MEIILTVLASFGTTLGFVTAALGFINRKKTNDIHLLVNSRLDQAIAEIEDLKKQRDILQDQSETKPA
jgi:hypothetical protein